MQKLLEDPQLGLLSWIAVCGEQLQIITDIWLGDDPESCWERKYKPMANLLTDEDRGFNNTLFETFGADLEFVRRIMSVRPRHVWTLVDTDEGQHIVPGYHLVNRVGYFITNEPFSDDDQVNLSIRVEDIDDEPELQDDDTSTS